MTTKEEVKGKKNENVIISEWYEATEMKVGKLSGSKKLKLA